ncbi:entry exclusion protein TrbK [Agrobacterium tumefaciens]|uniref:entry exclusion protein TrbK n=1 Tax=Agrobacterium tumefaciens TaxID=358 RepID=UPI0009757665|nr:entry exclusion protein TrbK [Agrobacterium tumefaciens]
MSPRLIVIIALVAVVSATVITWVVFQPEVLPDSGSGATATTSSTDEEKRRHREQFFGGNAGRDVRGGQEMKPRW